MVIARGSYARFTDYPPFLLLLTSTWADLLILLIIHLAGLVSPIKQHFMSVFSGNIFLMSLFKLFYFTHLTKGFSAKTPILI